MLREKENDDYIQQTGASSQPLLLYIYIFVHRRQTETNREKNDEEKKDEEKRKLNHMK